MSQRSITVHPMTEKPFRMFRYVLRDRSFSVVYTSGEFNPTHLDATGWVADPFEISESKNTEKS